MQAGAAVMGNLNGKQLYGIVKRPAAQKKRLPEFYRHTGMPLRLKMPLGLEGPQNENSQNAQKI